MRKYIIFLLFLLLIEVTAQQDIKELKQEVQELKQAVKFLMQKEKMARQKEKKSQQAISNLKQELENLKTKVLESQLQTTSKSADPLAQILAEEVELVIQDDFGEEDEEQEFVGIGYLADLTNDLTSGSLVIGGFFTLEYIDFRTADSSFEAFFPDEPTFSNSHINIFIDSKFYKDFRFYTELRFTYQPFTDFSDLGQDERSGEVVIERAWAEWEYRDWFKIRAGNFFVPYGIWNLEHGDPILLSTFTPVIVQRQIFPARATGLQVSGLVDFEDFAMQYYAWVGNGKGSQISTQDDQDSKAFGARIEAQIPLWLVFKDVAIGVSIYSGKVQGPEVDNPDVNDQIIEFLTLEQNFDQVVDFALEGLSLIGEPLDEYIDRAIGADFRFRFQNLFIQAEFAINYVTATETAAIDLDGDTIPDILAKAEPFYEYGGYVQFAYEVIMEDWGLLTPFFRMGFVENNKEVNAEVGSFAVITAGLNWKPNPHVVLKVEYSTTDFPDVNDREFDLFISSMSVGF